MKKPIMTVLMWLLSLMYIPNATATEFCATSSAGLEFSLAAAEANGQSDVIKITTGVYTAPVGGFEHLTNQSFDLEISGGWSELLGDPCGQQSALSAFNTVLDGDLTTRALKLRITGSSDVRVSNIFFANGVITGEGQRGGGLDVQTSQTYTGDVIIENNAFINNSARFGGALSISGGHRIDVRNNLFTINNTELSAAISLVQNDAYGIYFVNNTVYLNTASAAKESGEFGAITATGLYLWVAGSSQAFITNNVIWGNSRLDLLLKGNGSVYLYNNDIGSYSNENLQVYTFNNISADPELEVGLFNYTPAAGSPLINAGMEPLPVVPQPPAFNHNWMVGTEDLVGQMRVQMGGIDIGAVESALLDIIFVDGF